MVDENSVVDRNSIKLVDESSVVVKNTGLKLEEVDEKTVVYQSVFSLNCIRCARNGVSTSEV